MSRKLRKISSTGIYHIMLRRINKENIFEDEEDHEKFIQILERYKEKTDYKLYAYCLMGNHIHMLIRIKDANLGNLMKKITVSFVVWYNKKYLRTGSLFQERYKSEPVETKSYFLGVLRYIHQNPTKAKIVTKLKDYKWSSYNEYILKQRITDIDFPLDMFDPVRTIAIEAFIAFHEIESNFTSFEANKKIKYTDAQAIELVKEYCGLEHCSEFKFMDKKRRNVLIRGLRNSGFSSSQLSRITGLSKTTILRV